MALHSLLASSKGRLAWHANRWLLRHLWLLNLASARMTVEDQFGTPGDTLMTANVCRVIKRRFPHLRINCVTKNPDVIQHDPDIDELNGRPTYCHLKFEYLGILEARASEPNVLAPTLADIGIGNYEYKARVYLKREEIEEAKQRLPDLSKPVITVNVMSKEDVKVWRLEAWAELIARLSNDYSIVQLGDDKEPHFSDVISFAGKLNKRESMAMLKLACLHIGPDSFLMHAANGLDVPSVIIYGGARPSSCLGYRENINLYTQIECSPCWLHPTKGQFCSYGRKCMDLITVDQVAQAAHDLLARSSHGGASNSPNRAQHPLPSAKISGALS